MIKFSTEKVLLLQQVLIEATGGKAGVRDLGLLESALNSAYATFDSKELYPSKEEKAARIGFSLISNHAFVDGNKRIGMYVMLTFLEVNGIKLSFDDEDAEKLGWSIASGEKGFEDLLQWINNCK